MANEVLIQFAVPTILVVVSICLFIVFKKRREAGIERSRIVDTKTATPSAPPASVVMDVKPQTVVSRPQNSPASVEHSESVRTAVKEEEKQPLVLQLQPLATHEDRNQKILADISSNIRKSMIKPVAPYSPLQYPEATRETEYVRVKKQIITPHGQVRFSILKDSISSNMPALFRRASQEWKTPNDLIGFLPAYLEAEAEILEGQVLVIGTPGHNEKIAVPIKDVDADSSLRSCFDFVADARSATNTPAILLASSDNEFEVVSRGIVTQPVFINRAERTHSELKLLVENA